MPNIENRHVSSRLFAPLRGASLTRPDRRDHPLVWPAYGGALAQHAREPQIQAQHVPLNVPARNDLLKRFLMVCVAVSSLAVFVVVIGGALTTGGSGRLWTALVTGLTAGGLSCLAVQGGLLAAATKTDGLMAAQDQASRIAAFLAAKLTAYTLLGALLGTFGAAVQPSPTARGVVQAAIGLFMLGTGIQMIRPNRWTRRLVLEPPPRVRRWLRSRARNGAHLTDAAVLGGLTVLIPCGVTQAMMASAMALGTPLGGALLMAAFTLGTCPVFFGLAYGASSLGSHAQTYFNRAVAVLLLIMGFVAIQTGFALTGHPLPIRPILASTGDALPAAATTSKDNVQRVTVVVANDGYVPTKVNADARIPLELVFTSKNVTGCTRTLVIPDLHTDQVLPVSGTAIVKVPPQPVGSTLRWVCGMGMYSGQVKFR